METIVSIPKFWEFEKSICPGLISEKGQIKMVVDLQGLKYVGIESITPLIRNGRRENIILAIQAIPLEVYSGDLKPLTYNEHFLEVNLKKRKHGYNGMLVTLQNSKVVLSGENIKIKAEQKQEQLSIF
ncbi:hypothetical protein HN014_22235 (plasmid) [Aquimarina sp. TRL1]|uniref:hypothetical protein n=1 Tax=Aquimarina sp. (strain TRL1) TaxID=2736252 RepID=UPI00158BD0F1|nr:hypothetical protein [Aquimarina sp. TRL1]QKX07721.1 hypothetical protein HN014_22235 [Aquimarina sp. TRL1]